MNAPELRQPGPGLDLNALRALRPQRHHLPDLMRRIEQHLSASDGYLAFSGGKDSLVVLDLAIQVEPNLPVVFFDSGLEYPETYSYIQHISEHVGAEINWITPHRSALQILISSGAWQHDAPARSAVPNLHEALIAEPSRRAHDEYGRGELWGVRAAESRGRAALYVTALSKEVDASCTPSCCPDSNVQARRRAHGGVVRRKDGTIAFGPIWDWTDQEVWGHIARRQLPINPVYEKLRRIGAPDHFLRVSSMLDGSRLEHGRAVWLRRGWPELFEELATLLPRLREFG